MIFKRCFKKRMVFSLTVLVFIVFFSLISFMNSSAHVEGIVGVPSIIPQSPANNTHFTACSYYSPPTFAWVTSESFRRFEIQFSKDGFNSIPVRVRVSKDSTEVIIDPGIWRRVLLIPGASGGTVYWRIVGTRADRTTATSENHSLIIDSPQPVGNPSISPTSKNALPTLSWENKCNRTFRVWFGSDSQFTKKKVFTFNAAHPTDNQGMFARQLTTGQWIAIRKAVKDMSNAAIYWRVESWDVLRRHTQTDVMRFILDPFTLIKSISVDGGWDGDDAAIGMALDESGNLYVTGFVTKPGENKNIWLAKYDAHLNLQKSITINGSANGEDIGYTVALDGNGYLYVIGYITETGQDHNIWIAKFDTDLSLKKEIKINGSANSTDDGYGILYDGSEYLYVAGTVTETGQGYNIWVAKYDSNLTLQESTTLNGPFNNTDKGRFLVLDESGNLFVSGSVTQDVTDYDIWIGKFNATDLTLLHQTIVAGPTTGEDKGYGMVYDGAGTLYITGCVSGAGEGLNVWLAKYDTDFNLIDSASLNGPANGEDVAYSMVMDESRHLYLTGTYTEITGGANIWVAKYDTNLNLADSMTVDGPTSGYDTGYGIVRTGEDFYISGFVTEASGGMNIWLAHYLISP